MCTSSSWRPTWVFLKRGTPAPAAHRTRGSPCPQACRPRSRRQAHRTGTSGGAGLPWEAESLLPHLPVSRDTGQKGGRCHRGTRPRTRAAAGSPRPAQPSVRTPPALRRRLPASASEPAPGGPARRGRGSGSGSTALAPHTPALRAAGALGLEGRVSTQTPRPPRLFFYPEVSGTPGALRTPRTLPSKARVRAPREAGPPGEGARARPGAERGGRKGRGRGRRPRAEEQRGLGRRLPPAGLPGAPAAGWGVWGSRAPASSQPRRLPAGSGREGGRAAGSAEPPGRGRGWRSLSFRFASAAEPPAGTAPARAPRRGPARACRAGGRPAGGAGAGGDRNRSRGPKRWRNQKSSPRRLRPAGSLRLSALGSRGPGGREGKEVASPTRLARVGEGTRHRLPSARSLDLARRRDPEAGWGAKSLLKKKKKLHLTAHVRASKIFFKSFRFVKSQAKTYCSLITRKNNWLNALMPRK